MIVETMVSYVQHTTPLGLGRSFVGIFKNIAKKHL